MELRSTELATVFLNLELQKDTFNGTSGPPPAWVNTVFETGDHADFRRIAKGRSQRFPLLPELGSNGCLKTTVS